LLKNITIFFLPIIPVENTTLAHCGSFNWKITGIAGLERPDRLITEKTGCQISEINKAVARQKVHNHLMLS